MNDAHVSVAGLREVCHDIRQPIAGVLALAGAALAEADLAEADLAETSQAGAGQAGAGQAGAGQAGAGLAESTRNRLNQIIALAEWQSDVVENWLDSSTGCHPPGAGATDTVRVVNEAAAAERLTWTGDLILVWPPEPVLTRPHPVILRRMAANLLANATRAAGPAGTVTIEVSPRASWMLLVVEDDGPGFGGLSARYGLGLSAVARQAARHRGRLECGQGSLGGARASLWLPLAASAAGRAADATRPV